MKKILAIDDNEINLELIGHIIKLHYPDYEFLKSTSGKAGIELAKKEIPEIILLDVLMPEMNGYEVCELLKKEETTHNIPVLMISALGNDHVERTKGLNIGADAFVSKPFSQNEIKAQINVLLRIKRVEDLLRKRNASLELFIKDQTKKYLQNEERHLQISEHAMEFYWETDSKGVFTYISPVVEKTLKIDPNEIVGSTSYLELFQLQNKNPEKNQIIKSFIKHDRFKDCEIEVHIKNSDKPIWLSVSGFSVFKKNKAFYGMRGVCFDVTKYKEAEFALKDNMEQIRNYQKKLKDLNTQLTLMEENERRKIAETLHDSLGQTISLAFMKLSSIAHTSIDGPAKQVIEDTSKLLDQAIKESRILTYDLYPPILNELGIIPAIKWRLGKVEEQHRIATKLNTEESDIFIQKEYNIFLYRTICELLVNVIKHAQAKLIQIDIRKKGKMYYITVQDDGVGYNVKEVEAKQFTKGGFGLLSIKERISNINGKFLIESEIGSGTKATIVMPFSNNINHEN